MTIVVPDDQENVKLCLCPGCPTHKKGKLRNILYCSRGKAAKDVNKVACICPTCLVFARLSLDDLYYCLNGKATKIKQQITLTSVAWLEK